MIVVLLSAALCWGTATAQLNLLAVIWRAAGQSDGAIAAASAAASLAILVAAIAAGPLIERFGARRVIAAGAIAAFCGLCILPSAIASPAFSALARSLQGFGFGLALTAGILYAKACAAENDQIRTVGMFSASFMVPTLFAPAVGEWLLRNYGVNWFFAAAVVTMTCSCALIVSLTPTETTRPPHAGYLRLLRDWPIWLRPCAAVLVSGLGYGFATSFLPLMLVEHGVSLGWYFSPFAASLLCVRFIALRTLQRMPIARLAALGVGAVGAALAVLLTPAIPVALAGMAMGLGYAVIHPTAIEWASKPYAAAERARPVALINAVFHIGSIVAVQVFGGTLSAIGWSGALGMLLVISCSVFIIVVANPASAKNYRKSPKSLTTG